MRKPHIITLPKVQGEVWKKVLVDLGFYPIFLRGPDDGKVSIGVMGEQKELDVAWTLFQEKMELLLK